MSDGPEWFAPKRYGYGSGIPISWQGWAVTIGYILLAVLFVRLFANRPATLIAALAPPTIILMAICAKTTRGGWRWRWGEDDQ
jgi:hypothetical protein